MQKNSFPLCCGAYILSGFPWDTETYYDHNGIQRKRDNSEKQAEIIPWLQKMCTRSNTHYVVTLNNHEDLTLATLRSVGFKFTKPRKNHTNTTVRVGWVYSDDLYQHIGNPKESKGYF